MKWIRDFQLFLFDFDGLLVNTEHLHYQAYLNVMHERGFRLDWSFTKFCELAHVSQEALKEALYNQFPNLEPNWNLIYAEKKQAYLDLVASGKVELMPGVEKLLHALDEAKIKRCVVTNSPREQINLIQSQLQVLKTIDHWVTREDYEKAKPSPECYLKAISLHAKSGDKIVGFEDSLRGLRSLKQTPALPVLICPKHYPLVEIALDETESKGLLYFESFNAIPETGWPGL